MTLYETIFTRRSVRRFDMLPLDNAAIDGLRAFLDETKPLEGQSARFEIVDAGMVKNPVAPHYIMAFCAACDEAYANVGYVLQSADLYLQSLGYGCCWQGTARPNEAEDDYCILLAFGKSNVPPRQSVSEFKRLDASEICDSQDAFADTTTQSVVQAARLAPSAMNSQPWKLSFSPGKVTVRYFGRGMLKLILKKKMNKIDVGIIARHAAVALENAGKAIRSAVAKRVGKELTVDITY